MNPNALNLASARVYFPKRLKVSHEALYGEVESVDRDPADPLGALITVRFNSGRLQTFPAREIRRREDTFLCAFCHRQHPDHLRRKAYGVSIPKTCDGCLSQARNWVMTQQRKRGGP